jgi:hypothetical protein
MGIAALNHILQKPKLPMIQRPVGWRGPRRLERSDTHHNDLEKIRQIPAPA